MKFINASWATAAELAGAARSSRAVRYALLHNHHLECVDSSSGSLGQGLSLANGAALAAKYDLLDSRYYVMLGDGEIQKGQVWEAVMTSSDHDLDNVCAILDANSIQLDGPIDASTFMHGLLTLSFTPMNNTLFSLHMLVGFALLIMIPMTNMQHLILKYDMYHNIRWEDTPTPFSSRNQKKLMEALQLKVSWSADHIQGNGQKTWVDVATTNPAASQ